MTDATDPRPPDLPAARLVAARRLVNNLRADLAAGGPRSALLDATVYDHAETLDDAVLELAAEVHLLRRRADAAPSGRCP